MAAFTCTLPLAGTSRNTNCVDAEQSACCAQMPNLIAPETQMRGPGDPAAFVVDPADPEAWRAQLFRSIDSDSAGGMPPGSEASALGLDSGKGGATT